VIKDAYPLKAQYRSGEPVSIALELANAGNAEERWRIEMRVMRLDREVERVAREVRLAAGESRTLTVTLPAFRAAFDGFGVDIDLADSGGIVRQTVSTAFDVVSDWRKSIRYGFLSDFGAGDRGDEEDVKWLCKLHLNLVQFYDWMYRHEDLVSEKSEYTDLMGRRLSLETVKEKIALCRRHGMKAVAYGAVYAASKPFAELHPDWVLYQSDGKPYDFIGRLTIMNIAADCPWHRHIVGEYKRAVELADFDGIHLDTYGFPKTAVSMWGGEAKAIRLEEHFPQLIASVREELSGCKPEIALIFNNVGNWPVDGAAQAPQDAVYVEVWKPYERYHHIRQIIQQAQRAGEGKPVILAAYLKPFRTEADPDRARYAGLLLTAVIAAHGGSHLLAGEQSAVLTQAYYPDYAKIGDPFARELRQYCDFLVRYANLLHDGRLQDVSMTHADGDNREYVFDGLDFSTYGEAGKVWTVIRESGKRKTISFINLTGNEEDYWNEGKNRPMRLTDIPVRILLEKEVLGVYAASPDADCGRPRALPFRVTDSLRGMTLETAVPSLDVWTVLWVDLAD